MHKTRLFSLIAAFLALMMLFGCSNAGEPDHIDDAPLVITAQALPKLLVAVPAQIEDEFIKTGYDSFYTQLQNLSVEYRFDYDIVALNSAQDQFTACNQAKEYDWLYLHPVSESTLVSDVAQLSGSETGVVVFGDYKDTGVDANCVYLDYAGIGTRTGQYIAEYFADDPGRYTAIVFPGEEEWYSSYIEGIADELERIMALHEMKPGEMGADMLSYFDTLDKAHLAAVRCVIAHDGETAHDALDAILGYHNTGSVSINVSLIAFVGAQTDHIDNMTYSPIDKVTFNLSPTLMLNAANYVADFIAGEQQADELKIDFTMVDKHTVDDFKLSDEYLFRYLQ